ncbi:transposable element Tcb2 transposase [Trichonephila clavipes]|nr:transposable element Tcb2 transposase [Trichonephila clavipes]
MAKINHLDDVTRGRMIRKLREGRSLTSIAEELGINKNEISSAWKAFQTILISVRKVGLVAVRRKQPQWMTDILSCRTLHAFESWHRLEWCKENKNWTAHRWSRVLFFGRESFQCHELFSTPVDLERGRDRVHTSNITERDRYYDPVVVVWGGFMLNGWTGLHVFDRDFLTGIRYCKEVFFPHVRLF